MPSSATTSIHSTTQEFIDIYDITNDLIIMKDGSTALVLTVDAMNFGLLAEEEQDAVMYAYAGLLNSLNYSIQIVIRSQTKDATNYLNLLRDQEQIASSAAKRAFISEYRDFVANLIRERNVLDKKFYIAIPASALEMGLVPPSSVVPGVKHTDISTVERSVILDKAKTILEPKRDHLISQFGRLGLYARQLQTQEIIQLFYTSYNPEAAEGQQITDTSNYVTPLVQASTTASYDAPPTPPATPYAGTENLAPLLPNQPDPLNPTLLNSTEIYQMPPAIVEIPVPVDVQLNQTIPVTAPVEVAKPPVVNSPPAASPPVATATIETPIYSAPSNTPLPTSTAIPKPESSSTPAPNDLPLPSLPPIPEIK